MERFTLPSTEKLRKNTPPIMSFPSSLTPKRKVRESETEKRKGVTLKRIRRRKMSGRIDRNMEI